MNKPITNLCVLVLLFIITACQSPEARAPISRSSGSYIKEMAQRNKALTQKEQKLIMQYIEADSLHNYQDSKNGFWYTYDIKSELDTITPKFGDRVFYTYNVRSFNGDTIYSAEGTSTTKLFNGQRNFILWLTTRFKTYENR
jgi:gliding motility-associated peptidyl-prolyl isomerase